MKVCDIQIQKPLGNSRKPLKWEVGVAPNWGLVGTPKHLDVLKMVLNFAEINLVKTVNYSF